MAVSEANITFSYIVTYLNRAPIANVTEVPLSSILEDDVTNAGDMVGRLANLAGSDPDDVQLGLAVTSADQTNGIWQYRSSEQTDTWTDFPNTTATGRALQLNASSWVRFVPNKHYSGPSQFTAHLWDMSSAYIGVVDLTSEDVFTGPFSAQNTNFALNVLHINDPPVISIEVTEVVYTESYGPVSLFPNLTISDVDGSDLAEATVWIDCLDSSSLRTEACATSGDEVVAALGQFPFQIQETVPSISQSEFTITPLGLDRSIDSFVAYLRTLSFNNTDLEPSEQMRRIEMSVSDGVNSSNIVSVIVSIVLVNDEPPFTPQPFLAFYYRENSDPVQVFAGGEASIMDPDMIYPLESITIQLVSPSAAYETISVNCASGFDCFNVNNTITIRGRNSTQEYSQVLNSLTYGSVQDEPDPLATRSIIITAFDEIFSSIPLSLSIQTILINDKLPEISPSVSTVNFTEGTNSNPSTALIASELSVMDRDSGTFNIYGIQALLEAPLDIGNERIAISMAIPTYVIVYSNDTLVSISASENSVDGSGNMTDGLPAMLVQEFLNTLSYTNDAVQPTGTGRTVSITVSDNFTLTGVQQSSPALVNIRFVFTDDLPEVRLGDDQLIYSEGDPAILVTPQAMVIDVDDTDISGLDITLTSAVDTSQDVITVNTSLLGAINSTQNNQQTLTLTGISSTSAYTEVLRSLTYEHLVKVGNPPAGDRLIRVVPRSLNGIVGVADIVTIAFMPTNNHPVIDLNGPFPARDHSVIFREEGPPVYLVSRNFTLSDVDSSDLQYVLIRSENPSSGDELILSDEGLGDSNITVQINDDSSLIVIMGAPSPLEDFYLLLLNLQYANFANEPTPPQEQRNLTVTIEVNDGMLTASAVATVFILPTNDRPQLFFGFNSTESTPSYTEDSIPTPIARNLSIFDPDSRVFGYRVRPVSVRQGDVLRVPDSQGNDLPFNSALGFYFSPNSLTLTQVLAQLDLVTIASDQSEPEPGNRLVCFSVVDDMMAASLEVCSDITFSFINDSPPVFDSTDYSAEIQENRPHELVVMVRATDEDSRNSDVSLVYEIVGGDDCMATSEGTESGSGDGNGITPQPEIPLRSSCRFTINATTGVISTTATPPDFEERSFYNLTVQVSDGVQQSIVIVSVTIQNVNDLAPQFVALSHTATVPLGAEAGYLIDIIEATDVDQEILTVFLMDMAPMRMGLFSISPNGSVFLRIPENVLPTDIARYNLTFNVTDGQFFSSSPATLEVNVILNDATPQFDQNIFSVNVSELTPVGITVLQIMATDSDTGSNAAISYTITPESPVFAVNRTSGDIVLTRRLDFETTQNYSFTVVATDSGRPQRSGTTAVSVQVINENEEAPIFERRQIRVPICEDAVVGAEIARVTASDTDAGSFGAVTYILADRGNTMDLVALNYGTGSLTIARQFDFEGNFRTFMVSIVAQDGGGLRSMEAQVQIDLLNNNEFPPVFSQSIYQTTIPENYPVSNPLPLLDSSQIFASDGDGCNVDQCDLGDVVNTDPCSGASGVTYSISSGNTEGLFAINRETGMVYLTTSLDFDKSAHRLFVLELIASDGEFTDNASVIVTVTDFNEHLPVFGSFNYSATILENIPVGSVLRNITATDVDPTSVIQYTLAGQGAGDFTIGVTSGVVASARPLSFLRQQVYNLAVTAMNPPDGTNGSQPVTTTLTINVIDVNNHSPDFVEDSYTFSVPENTPPASLGRVEATDMDAGVNAIITYSILSAGNGSFFFIINGSTGEIFSTSPLDRELQSRYDLVVQARDGGNPALSSTVNVTILITDENDNSPRLQLPDSPVTVSEDAPINFEIATIRASDPDDPNTIFTYTIVSGNSGNNFAILSNGTMIVARSLDREQTDSYTLIVAVSDSGSPQQTSMGTIMVIISDINDNPPVFSMTTYSTSVSEAIPPEYSFVLIQASDADQGTNANISFSIDNATVPFQIDSATGDVSVSNSGEIDRERVSYYTLIIRASNPDSLSSTAELVVQILDENDNAPMFVPETLAASVDEDFTPVGSMPTPGSIGSGMGIMRRFVSTVIAADMDQPNTPNSQVTYSLVSVSPPGYFEIEGTTGELYATQVLDRESVPSYVITIQASDGNATATQRSYANVTVTVGDINDNIPFFTNASFSGMVLENAAIQTEVLRLTASDYDLGPNAILVFSVETGTNVPFEVVSGTGSIRTSASLDRETTPRYTFTATVANPGMEDNRASVMVDITIVDVNDNPPVLSPASVSLTIDENQPIGEVLVSFTITDADIGINAATNLTLSGSSSLFRLSPSNQLVVSYNLDYEMPEHRLITFEVEARNTEPPMETARSRVQIELNNLNDNPPIVNFRNTGLNYFERNKRLVLNTNPFITDEDGVNITTLVDGIVEMVQSDPREPSEAFTPNTNDAYLPYDCPLEDDKIRKFEPCNLTLRDDHVFTRVSTDLFLRNFEAGDIMEDTYTISFNSMMRQFAYSSIASNFLQTGLTISTWVWFDFPEGGSSAPFTIVSKASPTSLLYSVYCSTNGQDLEFQYQSIETVVPVVFSGVCSSLQGAWNHLAVVLDNSNPAQWQVVVFINAKLHSREYIFPPVDMDGSVFVGTRPNGVNADRKDFFNGRLHLLLFSYAVANANELNCAIGCGAAIISTLENTPLEYSYSYATRSLSIRGRYSVPVYEEFLNSLVLVLPLIEPVSPTYLLNYTVQDDMFNCLPNSITVTLLAVNDHQPQLNLNGDLPVFTNDSNFTAIFIEEAGRVAIVNQTGLSLTDSDLVAFRYSVVVRILNPQPLGSMEVLNVSFSNLPEGLNVTYENYILTIIGVHQLPIFQSVLRTVTYNNLDDEPVGDHRLIQFTVTDTPEDDVHAFSSIDIVLVNDAPEVNLNFSLREYSEGDGAVRFLESASVTDSDNTFLTSALVRFNIRDLDSEIISVNTANTNLTANYDNRSGELSITGEDTPSRYAMVLESLTYEHINVDNPSPGTRVFYISVSDGQLSSSNSSGLAMVFFSAVNDQPMVDLNGDARGINSEALFREDIDTSILLCPQAVLIDVDNTSLYSLSISLSPQPDGDQERITVDLPSDLEQNRTEILSGSGFPLSIEQYQTILRTLRYENDAEEPTQLLRTVQVTASDGAATSIAASAVITIEPNNDIPVVDIDTTSDQPGYQTTYMENEPAVNITGRSVTISDNDANAQISSVLISIQGARDEFMERITSTDPSFTLTPMLLNNSVLTYTGTFEGVSLQEAEVLLTTLQYENLRDEPFPGTREISIFVSDGNSFSVPEITTLEVITINEHSPVFSMDSYSRDVQENLTPEVFVTNITVSDGDSGPEGQVSYQIQAADPPQGLDQFRIDSNGNIFTTTELDREAVDCYTLNITANDGGNPQRSDTAQVKICVIDQNDERPAFVPGTQFELNIAEGGSGMVLVYMVEASDADFNENGIVTYSLEGTSPIFSVQENGSIYANADLLDADIPNPSYVITVLATDGGTPPLQTAANFTITVTDINDNAPQFTQNSYSGEIRENAAPGTSIVTVSATDVDSGENGRLSYSISYITDSPTLRTPFSINESTGLVTNIRVFDTESDSDRSPFSFIVEVVDNGNPQQSSQVALVTVRVLDENDNIPMFERPLYSASLVENSPNETFVLNVSATDRDSGINGQVTYHIISNSDILPPFSSGPLFTINPETGEVVVNGNIDFEMRSEITFVVEARDMGSPSNTGNTTVVLSVIDINDNRPQFTMSTYPVSVNESAPIGFVVYTVLALDADSNQNGEVSYSLVDHTNTFAINPTTGEISTTKTLDFETDCYYMLLAVATDNGLSQQLNDTAIVEISLNPVHDVPPVFSRPSYSATVMENLMPGSSILQVSATDGDITECAELSSQSSGSGALDITTIVPTTEGATNFVYSQSNHFDFFSIDNETGLIRALILLDYETSPQYVLQVQATDPGGLFSEVSVTVTLLDLNDNLPMFDQPSYTRTVPENTPIGTTLLQLTATDGDLIDQGRLTFSLGTPGVFVEINNRTGAIVTTGAIDFDTFGSLLRVIALVTDTANQETSAVVRLTVTDIVDIPPEITTPPRVLSFTEGSFSLLPVPNISITDGDTSQILCSATITLSTTGTTNTASECSCQGSQVSSCTPGCNEFLQSAPGSFPGTAMQSENGRVLMLVGNFTIQIYEAAIQSIQYINLVANPVPETRTVTVYVFDCQLPSNTLMNTINVQPLNVFPPVVDLNGMAEAGIDHSVTFTERGSAVYIAMRGAIISDNDTATQREELTGLDISITNPQVGDYLLFSPSHVPSGVSYQDAAHSLNFTGVAALSEYTALLLQVRYINREDEPEPSNRVIQVTAHEYHLSSVPATTTVFISTINDYPPVILTQPPLANRETSYYEEAPAVAIASPSAVISDIDSSSDPVTRLQVSLTQSSPYDLLFLNISDLPSSINMLSTSTNVSLEFNGNAPVADYQQIVRGLQYKFTGEEFDYIFPLRFVQLQVADTIQSSFSVVQIRLVPINDQVPVFNLAEYRVNVPENSTVGSSVARLEASDGDRFSTNNIQYSIVSGNDGNFFSLTNTGDVVLARMLDHETARMHQFLVQVEDTNYAGAAAIAPSTATVTIFVVDVNDQVPMFDSSEYNATIGEGVPLNTEVLQVNASDQDSLVHSALEFELSGTTDFRIDQNGRIFTNADIDREMVPLYQFFVTVRNPGQAPFSTARVRVTVLDLDDNPPVIVLSPNTGTLTEPNTVVPLSTSLTITDLDPNPSLDFAIVRVMEQLPLARLVSTVDSSTLQVSGNETGTLVINGTSRPLSDYISVLRGVIYQDLAEEPMDVIRSIAYRVGSNPNFPIELEGNPAETTSNISLFTVTVRLVNDQPPVLSLDQRSQANLPSPCLGSPGSYSANYTENQATPITLSHSSLAITDNDSGENMIQFAEVLIQNAADRVLERLAVSLSVNSSISIQSSSDDFRIVLYGPGTLQEYAAALRSVV